MEDYIRGVLCGYLQVQNGTRDNAKRKRTFVVLSDARMDYYLTDPRPTFTARIDATYFLTEATRVHHYLELNSRAPPHSICLTTDKTTDVYIADSQEEADLWFRHLSERLEALSTMLKGALMLRKEISATQQLKRFVLKTKYRWKARYVELGRSTLRFCKASDHKTKTMKQFTLTATSFAGQENTTYLRQLSVLASNSIPVVPTPQTLKGIQRIEKVRREQEERNQVDNSDTSLKNNEVRPKGSSVAAFYPFIVTTGQAFILLAAPTEQIRTHWILAIRLRIIALKYRHNGGTSPRKQPGILATQEVSPYQLQSFVEAQPKPGGPWKQHYVELDNGMLRVKKSERKLGSVFEVQLVPTCRVTPLLDKANAFTVRCLGCEVAFAPGSATEARRWMELIRKAAAAVDRTRCQKVFHDDIQKLLRHSVVYSLDVASETSAGIVLMKHKKRIFVLSHEPLAQRPPRRLSMAAIARRTKTSAIIPQGSVLVGISQFGMEHDSVDTIWHTLRQKKGCYKQAKRLLFRAPAVKEGVVRVKFRAADDWELHRCRLANGMFRVTQSNGNILTEVTLRDCEVALFSDDDCVNGIKLTSNVVTRTLVSMNVAVDNDAFLWFAMLQMEISVAQNNAVFPLTTATLVNTPVAAPEEKKLTTDQAKSYRECSVVGTRVEEIEKYVHDQEQLGLGVTENDQEVDSSKQVHGVFPQSSATLSSADITRFFQHLDVVGSGKVSSSCCSLSLEEFTAVMANVTHPPIVELVRKEAHNDIQCI
ncbi:uncharacterized protein PITG_13795 [Phytophthora infestans T30-4]|uniref:PH domain-containing protein n=1 Tax=Phytophthora infestans (strain T30-4) TaxID=403677 RepID=D0NMT8_PHYIT|nr:uncharacterized protein PITG_13795 [Phytophthora infestans T30-4]EEY61845.1 conserved hypothetical protein [Phytophthora infestans T30-4]|eukprot:XP_002899485.1 conserved hypothetical protein [Phytophthora infestans T30-4]